MLFRPEYSLNAKRDATGAVIQAGYAELLCWSDRKV